MSTISAMTNLNRMQTPKLQTFAQYAFALQEQMARSPDGRCQRCHSEIQVRSPVVSLHYLDFAGCGGVGDVLTLPVFYCPYCEGEPAESGCLHVLADESLADIEKRVRRLFIRMIDR